MIIITTIMMIIIMANMCQVLYVYAFYIILKLASHSESAVKETKAQNS